jgi:hypothetical protein
LDIKDAGFLSEALLLFFEFLGDFGMKVESA